MSERIAGSTEPWTRRGESLGVCERCGVDIPVRNVLIRYQTADGWPKLFAECPACEDVVHPE